MSAGTYDPFAVERPVLRLGEHGEWTLGDITDSRHAKLVGWHDEFAKLNELENAKIEDLARCVGGLVEVACVNADGFSDLLMGLCDESVHGDDALGGKALTGVVSFIMGFLTDEESAGNV